MSGKRAKKIRKQCRVFLDDMKAQKFRTRVKIAWEIIKGNKKGTK